MLVSQRGLFQHISMKLPTPLIKLAFVMNSMFLAMDLSLLNVDNKINTLNDKYIHKRNISDYMKMLSVLPIIFLRSSHIGSLFDLIKLY